MEAATKEATKKVEEAVKKPEEGKKEEGKKEEKKEEAKKPEEKKKWVNTIYLRENT